MNEFTLLNKNNKKLNIIEGVDIEEIKLIIIHIHGIGSHFQPVFECIDEFKNRDLLFSNFNFKSFALEFEGHGKSEGNRCSINSFDNLLEDLDTLINYIIVRYEKPIFLLSESMGCAVALKYSILNKEKINGLIFLAPLFGIDEKLIPNYLITSLLSGLSFILPEIQVISNNLSAVAINNQEFINAKEKNTYSYKGNHRLNTCREMLNISNWISNNGYLLETPILIFHGIKDTITNPMVTKCVFDNMISKDKELHLLEEGYHCLLIESEENPYLPGYIMGKIVHWINKRI
jgi:alpha-beta hydrolase superfamily lysophospholipase